MSSELPYFADPESLMSPADTKAGRYQRACYKLLLEHDMTGAIPTNGRFVFYELAQAGTIPKHYEKTLANGTKVKPARQPSHDISDALMDLREAGLIPWDWIIDETREVVQPLYHDTVADAAMYEARTAQIDLWGGKLPPLIICESRAIKGILTSLIFEYLVPITATGGQAGGFLVTEVAPLFVENDREVLYIGDLEIDGPGEQIEANTKAVIEKHAGRVIKWTRIALTQDQVDANPALKKLGIDKLDTRNKPAKKYLAYECEAFGQVPLMDLVRVVLDGMLPEPLVDVRVREQAERDEMIAALRRK